MWSAFMNGSGLHGGGGTGGGYVPSQGWEFVPCSRMDRGDRDRGKARSPLRRISSPPTVFSQIYEPQFGASPGGGEGGPGTQLEILRGQMWPGPEPQQQQQQTQHSRLKKKFEDLKKRHVQDKEDWMREKESLLREVADIQGGENRRILLDLKTVLEEVQAEVKREEEKRSELQLQYTRDRCAWELEKAELKCRIAQLEAREGTGLVSGGVQSALGPGSVASQSTREQHSETSTLRREREEQRRILADTHSTAMDLRYRLEHNERDWLREKAELLERFDVERREWESQLKDMQRKIEELYCEVRAKREGTGLDSGRQDDEDVVHRLSIRSTSTGSSLLSDNTRSEPLSSSSQSEPNRQPLAPGFGHNRNISGGGYSICEFIADGQFSQNNHSQSALVDELRSRGTWQQDSVDDSKGAVDTTELDVIFHGAPGYGMSQRNVSKGNENNAHVGPQESPVWAELIYGSDKKKNTTALNAALKEIARVSEELCSYQDEIRKKSGDKRNRSESLCLTEESEMTFGHDKTRLEVDEAPCDLSQIYNDLRALERENWITLSPNNTWRANRAQSESCRASAADPDSYRDTQTSPGILSEMDTAAPPIPPRTSSWNLSTPTHPDTELHIPESPMTTVRKCHSPCVLLDRKCSSPSIVRKFEAMLQENEGKVFIDGVIASCSVPTNSNCNMGCCHNRWSCDASKFSSNSTIQSPEVQPRQMRCGLEGQEVRMKQEISSDLSPEQPQVGLREATTITPQSPAHHSEVKHKYRTASSPSRKTQNRAATEALFSEPVLSANSQPGQNVEGSSSKNENPHGAKPQPARVGVLLQPLPAESKQRQMTQPGHQAQPKHASIPPSQSDSSRHGPRMMNDHPWKPLTLAAYPRPEGSRSNYGALERILKNYESAARAQQSQNQQSETASSPNLSVRQEETVTELDMLDMDPLPLPPTLRHTQTSHTSQIHTTHAQLSSHTAMGVKEMQLTVQENEESSVSSFSVQKNFSRPARPANRRLPSRWASRSPSSSSSTSSSPSTTPVMPPSFPLQKHTSSFTYSHAFHIETVII
ncbi:uncharacterized protein KIAA0408-like isoform X1 [Lates japonicus]